jgi:hypothetical protein
MKLTSYLVEVVVLRQIVEVKRVGHVVDVGFSSREDLRRASGILCLACDDAISNA